MRGSTPRTPGLRRPRQRRHSTEDPTLPITRYTPDEVIALLNVKTRPRAPSCLDLRSRRAFNRQHLTGAVSIPAPRFLKSLYLLPPRDRNLIILADRGSVAATWAERLERKGWRRVGYLDASPRGLDPSLYAAGPTPNRIWQPPAWLRRFEDRLPRGGSACDLACGSGRSAVHLALRGHDVLGVDILPDALSQARSLARAACVPPPGRLILRRVDLADPEAARRLLRPGRFRILCCFRYLDRALLPLIGPALAPGGWLLYQTFLEEQARRVGKPSRPAFLLKPGELRRAIAGLNAIEYNEGPDEEGNHLASIAARRD
jgi:tellurite methyltransferase